ncbi:HAD-IA family hydrolase [Luteolibacter pohnpeiensis]|uniref:phosphoglycolate phosphatase n=1 Tax=Luteolibacter pohnpeiensis TaxID=454153 RepID=A0A934VVC0_9BACT|nr:HAD-IA family hydrolase [Luteolibacter pohnpeiensis]MBK1881374.1 HAD-IA family hydrolase [Luteolibacter pohnpeiensis]
MLQASRVTRALIFDLDGTLVDSLPGITASVNHALHHAGFSSHTESAVRGFIGNGSRILIERAVPSGTSTSVIDQVEAEFKRHYDANWPLGTSPYPGIPELLAGLKSKGHPLAVLSNKPEPFTLAIVNALFPNAGFSAIVGQRNGIPHKPDPRGALEIAAEIAIPAENCVLIGDSTIDIQTARAAKMTSIAVGWGYHDAERLHQERPDHFVQSIDELAMHCA